MWTVFLWVYVFLFAVNGMLFYVGDASGSNLVSPLTNTTIVPQSQPNIINMTNGTNTLLNNVTTDVNNATSGSPFDFLTDSVFFGIQTLWNFIQLLTGAFVFNAVSDIVGFPSNFVVVIQGLLGFFLVLTILHFWTGRF